nr:hypothetical protein [Brasilonema sp. UFV-L1]
MSKLSKDVKHINSLVLKNFRLEFRDSRKALTADTGTAITAIDSPSALNTYFIAQAIALLELTLLPQELVVSNHFGLHLAVFLPL